MAYHGYQKNCRVKMNPAQYLICLVTLLSFISNVTASTLHSMTKKEIKRALINKTLISIPTDNLNGKTINNTFTMYISHFAAQIRLF